MTNQNHWKSKSLADRWPQNIDLVMWGYWWPEIKLWTSHWYFEYSKWVLRIHHGCFGIKTALQTYRRNASDKNLVSRVRNQQKFIAHGLDHSQYQSCYQIVAMIPVQHLSWYTITQHAQRWSQFENTSSRVKINKKSLNKVWKTYEHIIHWKQTILAECS